jgi:hypothetical protein
VLENEERSVLLGRRIPQPRVCAKKSAQGQRLFILRVIARGERTGSKCRKQMNGTYRKMRGRMSQA